MFGTWISSDLITVVSQGFLLCASLIIAVGPQNLFILRQGLRRQHLFLTALLSTLVDLLLISIGVGGLGSFISANSQLLTAATWGGATYLLGYGISTLRAAWYNHTSTSLNLTAAAGAGLQKTVVALLAISFLNPAAYLDTILMVGTTSGQYPVDQRIFFGIGAAIASAIWFFALTYGSSRLKPLLGHRLASRTLDLVSGCIICGVAFSMFDVSTLFA